MSNPFDVDTEEVVSPRKSNEIVAEFAGMRDLGAFDSCPEKLVRLLEAIEELDDVPPHMSQYTLDQLQQAVENVRYFKLGNGVSPYTGLLDDLDLFFNDADDGSDDDLDTDDDDDDYA